MRPIFIYCYDAYCGWCYGFSPNIRRLFDTYADRMDFEVLSGGMIPNDKPAHVSRMAGYLVNAYKTVEDMTGVSFGADWLWHVQHPEESDWYPHSEKAAIALCIVKELRPDQQVYYAADLQHSLYAEGRDLTDDEAYRHLLPRYQIPADEFYHKLHSEAYLEKAKYDFALCRQLQVSGFPTAFIQVSDTKLYMVARGYTPYEAVAENIEKVLAAVPANNASGD